MFAKVAQTGLFLAVSAVLAGCGYSVSNARAASVPRIVTLMPSFAQDACALGADANLVGVSEYSKSAPCARNLPTVGNFSSIDAEKIVALHPNVVVAIPDQQLLTAPLRRAGIRIVYLRDDSYEDIFSDIRQIGDLTLHQEQAARLVAQLRKRTRELQASEHIARRPRVFVVLQAQPIWTVGPQSYISTLLRLAGARNAVTSLPRAYAQYSAEALVRLQPDAIISDSTASLQSVLGRQPWRSLRAARQGHVFLLKDASVLETPGPNYNEGLVWLIERLRPLTAR